MYFSKINYQMDPKLLLSEMTLLSRYQQVNCLRLKPNKFKVHIIYVYISIISKCKIRKFHINICTAEELEICVL